MSESIKDFGSRMAKEYLNGTSEYASKGSAFICEYEGFTSTQNELDFLEGWNESVAANDPYPNGVCRICGYEPLSCLCYS